MWASAAERRYRIRAYIVERPVVCREAHQGTETVRDTVHETRVDVDKEAAERATDVPNRNL